MKQQLKLALVGTGKIVREVLPLLRGWGWEPAALCSTPRSEAAMRELCAQYGIPRGYTDYDTLLAQGGFDAVYIAVPNGLHDSFAEKALRAGCNAIVEKPFVTLPRRAEALFALAEEKQLFLWEAISTPYQPNYRTVKQLLPRLGRIRLAESRYLQYSSRYDAFARGETPAAFDPALAGGACMDLGLYGLHWLVGLFGAPQGLQVTANVVRGIDTSAAALLKYDDFTAVMQCAKDCDAPPCNLIAGEKGVIMQELPPSAGGKVTLRLRDGTEEVYDTAAAHRLESEFIEYARQLRSGDISACRGAAEATLTVCRLLLQARQQCGVVFAGDENA